MPHDTNSYRSGNELNLLQQSLPSFCIVVAAMILEYYEEDFKQKLSFLFFFLVLIIKITKS